MAANRMRLAIAGSLGKRFVSQIWGSSFLSPAPLPSVAAAAHRGIHTSTYDKDSEDHVRLTAVSDHVIGVRSEEYWEPHPMTGVFGPAGRNQNHHQGSSSRADPASAGKGSSALDQTVFFRPLEDVDKPPSA